MLLKILQSFILEYIIFIKVGTTGNTLNIHVFKFNELYWRGEIREWESLVPFYIYQDNYRFLT